MTDPVSRETLEWYLVQTQAQKEHIASRFIRGLGHETLYLRYRTQTRHARKVTEVDRPYFPRYIFAGVEDAGDLSGVNSAFGVSTVVYCGDKPVEVPLPVIEELAGRADAHGYVAGVDPVWLERRQRLEKGQMVKIDLGPFQGFIGQVRLDSGAKVKLWLDVLHRRVKAEFPPDALSPT